MLVRIACRAAIAAAFTVTMTGAGHAQFQSDPDGRLSGGAPTSKMYSLFGTSPVPKTTVNFETTEKPGSIVIITRERRLYYILGDGKAIRYGIGVGRPGFTWSGVRTVTAKKEWPGWTPPAQMLKRRPDLPRFMAGGPENPLGARAMYLGSTLYRIHGSNEPETIGQAVSSGCFRLTNEDVKDLYDRVKVGARVVIQQ
ncbi:MAG TPA: L,D-transpeptidase [Pseudorhodoplanes sp.]|jgi:lipoprotein-anchoring transpeptidase ErfK/SrfK|nr:L,D-transpeptidase [Pseudorhodoplanes sp.]